MALTTNPQDRAHFNGIGRRINGIGNAVIFKDVDVMKEDPLELGKFVYD